MQKFLVHQDWVPARFELHSYVRWWPGSDRLMLMLVDGSLGSCVTCFENKNEYSSCNRFSRWYTVTICTYTIYIYIYFLETSYDISCTLSSQRKSPLLEWGIKPSILVLDYPCLKGVPHLSNVFIPCNSQYTVDIHSMERRYTGTWNGFAIALPTVLVP